jgi:hypothetical protein
MTLNATGWANVEVGVALDAPVTNGVIEAMGVIDSGWRVTHADANSDIARRNTRVFTRSSCNALIRPSSDSDPDNSYAL